MKDKNKFSFLPEFQLEILRFIIKDPEGSIYLLKLKPSYLTLIEHSLIAEGLSKFHKKNKRNISRIDRLLEIPQEIYSNVPKITITGFNEMIIENFKGILEYEDYYIRINTSLGIINVNGYELRLENMTNDDIKVTGKIEKFDIERNFDE